MPSTATQAYDTETATILAESKAREESAVLSCEVRGRIILAKENTIQALTQEINRLANALEELSKENEENEAQALEYEQHLNQRQRGVDIKYSKLILPLLAQVHPERMSCCFCYEDVSPSDPNLVVTHCGHVFHSGEGEECRGLVAWWASRAAHEQNCPTCRTPLMSWE